MTTVRNKEELIAGLKNAGLPAVLKTDGSSGGRGVSIIKTQADAEVAFRNLSYTSIVKAVKRLLIDSDATLLPPSIRHDRARVSIQPFIGGRRASTSVACWRGNVLAQVSFEVSLLTERPDRRQWCA